MVLIDIFTNKKVDYFTVFASLPDMGRVGGLVSSYLAGNLEAEHIANIISNPKPWVNVRDGVIESAKDVYKIYFSDSEKLLILLVMPSLRTIGNFLICVIHFLIFVCRLVK